MNWPLWPGVFFASQRRGNIFLKNPVAPLEKIANLCVPSKKRAGYLAGRLTKFFQNWH